MNKLIIIEDENQYQTDDLEDIVKVLVDENYYGLSEKEKKQKLKMKALANNISFGMEIVEEADNIEGKFIVKDEITYILSLLVTNRIILLERKDADIFTAKLDKRNVEDNYIVVNYFAKKLLEDYIGK